MRISHVAVRFTEGEKPRIFHPEDCIWQHCDLLPDRVAEVLGGTSPGGWLIQVETERLGGSKVRKHYLASRLPESGWKSHE